MVAGQAQGRLKVVRAITRAKTRTAELSVSPKPSPTTPPAQPITGAPMATLAVRKAWNRPVAEPRSSGFVWSASNAEIEGRNMP